ncbi:HTH-type transcriptional regulator LutR [Roseovarius sp. A-2]|uniref:FadR/GntR family transcriptional regulator n=1 Tax=Roseovarius sp. A-2 TaxID=1570360 RepID=UPI0009B58688|nr:FCD domain-containing protein [Roseovarius sp. A-2]GAW35072.1 HTH-type transcriptional regulator LutR [Roseovarius sp. A-2]
MKRTEDAETALCHMIEAMAPGERLPSERSLCEDLKISRGTLRVFLERLEARKKVWRHVGRGTFAGSRPLETNPGLSVVADTTSPHELLEMRLIFEPKVAQLAALRASRQQISQMWYCAKKTGIVTDSKAYELWDATLHRTIAEAAHNKLLLDVFDAINDVRNNTDWGRLRDMVVSTPARQRQWWMQHEDLVDAIAARNESRAEEAMRKHIESVQLMIQGAARNQLSLMPE